MVDQWRIFADTGGTFTDVLGVPAGASTAERPDAGWRRVKVLSSGVVRLPVVSGPGADGRLLARWSEPVVRGFFRGFRVRSASDVVGGVRTSGASGADGCFQLEVSEVPDGDLAAGAVLELSNGEPAPVLGARVLTGTAGGDPLPLEELRLATTRGTNALLEEKGARVAFFVTEGFEDLLVIGDQKRPDLFARVPERPAPLHAGVFGVAERVAPDGSVVRELDAEALRGAVAAARSGGYEAAAVCLLHSYANPAHEQRVERVLENAGFGYVVRSSAVASFVKAVPRAETTVVDAYLGPILEDYLARIERACGGGALRVMTSAGGLVARGRFRPKDSLLSGPAGGVVGVAAIGARAGENRLISFDMGGTSTDVARVDDELDYTAVQTVGRARLLAPGVRIETVAAGGGSICGAYEGAPFVGPESAGANPGPAAYGRGGPLTVTDVNLLLGRVCPERFSLPLDDGAARAAFEGVCEELEGGDPYAEGPGGAETELLAGFLALADQRMADAIRRVSIREGYGVEDRALVSFGGAGGQHACAVAELLGVRRIVSPVDAGLLSAFGLARARLQRIVEIELLTTLEGIGAALEERFAELAESGFAGLVEDGAGREECTVARRSVFLRFLGQESTEEVDFSGGTNLEVRFRDRFAEKYGYIPEGRGVEVVGLRCVCEAGSEATETEEFAEVRCASENAAPMHTQRCYCGGGWRDVPVYDRDAVEPGVRLRGPALVADPYSVFFLAPGWEGTKGSLGTLRVDRVQSGREPADGRDGSGLIKNELIINRLEGIAGEMGVLLERTALSTNIKERLDFSCAVLDRNGDLVVNAPHVPVHLGALGLCVKTVMKRFRPREGDVFVTNHPGFGGSHLPDITLITPVFAEGALFGFVANRAHHAELGGIRPGSMPPGARTLAEEGVVLPPRRLFDRGESRIGEFAALLEGGAYPSRSAADNLADLNAQLAANRLGVQSLLRLLKQEGGGAVGGSLAALLERGRKILGRRMAPYAAGVLRASEMLDDATPLEVRMDFRGNEWTIDFSGTGPRRDDNLNATPAIVRSALMYVFRLLIDEPLPLNEGLLHNVHIFLPKDSLLNPDFDESDPGSCPPVVGGNVEVSQRLVDLLLKPFGVVACSQGTMNNFIFGGAAAGSHYETIGGGAGAGPDGVGGSGLHVHMTNTAITDPEILERRYPVRLEQFALRRGSGGGGRHRGGDGLIRRIRFEASLEVSLLTQHRNEGPYGMAGGGKGRPGEQILFRGGKGPGEPLDALAAFAAEPGDVLEIRTPGGGGFGTKAETFSENG